MENQAPRDVGPSISSDSRTGMTLAEMESMVTAPPLYPPSPPQPAGDASVDEMVKGAVRISKRNCKLCCGRGYNNTFVPTMKNQISAGGEGFCPCAVKNIRMLCEKMSRETNTTVTMSDFDVFKVTQKDGTMGYLVAKKKETKETAKNEEGKVQEQELPPVKVQL